MNIYLTYGVGAGDTEISAFDRALWDAGIGDYNLIFLSSVIPAGSNIVVGKVDFNGRDIGRKLYAVISKSINSFLNDFACAGLGWAVREDGSGVFLEESGDTENETIKKINSGLESMVSYRNGNYSNFNKIAKIKCEGRPVCAVVAAIYKSEGW